MQSEVNQRERYISEQTNKKTEWNQYQNPSLAQAAAVLMRFP